MFGNAFKMTMLTLTFLVGCKKNDLIIPQSSDFINPLKTKQDKIIHDIFIKHKDKINTVGLTIGVLKNDSTSFYGYGEIELGKGQVPQSNTFFEIGSITKVFTAIATVDFLNARNLTIDEPIQRFLPSSIPALEKDGQAITFKHILTHTSGLPYFPDNMGLNMVLNSDKAFRQYDTTKLYKFLKEVKLESKPSTVWNYSNLAVGTLGTILERNTNKKYEAIIKEKITTPLALFDTKQTLSSNELNRMAKGYHGSKKIDYWDDLNALNGAGVLRSTTADLLKFAKANISIPPITIGKSIAKCQKGYFLGKIKDSENEMNMGLGWLLLKDESGNDILFHDGGTAGFSTNLFILRDKKIAFVLFFNSVANATTEVEARQKFIKEIIETITK